MRANEPGDQSSPTERTAEPRAPLTDVTDVIDVVRRDRCVHEAFEGQVSEAADTVSRWHHVQGFRKRSMISPLVQTPTIRIRDNGTIRPLRQV